MKCTCWVADQSEEERYCIRYGAHSQSCPLYRVSLDPVDRTHDEELRAKQERAHHWNTGDID